MTAREPLRGHAAALYQARRSRSPIPPLTATHADLTITDAYTIQGHLVDHLLEDGGHVVGQKIGLTSRPMQDLLGVDQPDFGPVLSDTVFPDGHVLDLDDFCQPKIEAEIAFTLKDPLRGPGVTATDAAGAVGTARAALELVDSRIADWKITIVDTIADLASSAAVVLSDVAVVVDGTWDPRLTGMVVERNGDLVATGAGAAALGNPMEAVAWLANTLSSFGAGLEAGDIVLTGALHAAFPIERGDRILAEFDRLGSVGCLFR